LTISRRCFAGHMTENARAKLLFFPELNEIFACVPIQIKAF